MTNLLYALYVYLAIGFLVGFYFLFIGYRGHWRRERLIRQRKAFRMPEDGKTWIIWVVFIVSIVPILNLYGLWTIVIRPWWSHRKVTIVK